MKRIIIPALLSAILAAACSPLDEHGGAGGVMAVDTTEQAIWTPLCDSGAPTSWQGPSPIRAVTTVPPDVLCRWCPGNGCNGTNAPPSPIQPTQPPPGGTPAKMVDLWSGSNVWGGSGSRLDFTVASDFHASYQGVALYGWRYEWHGLHGMIRSIETGSCTYVAISDRTDVVSPTCTPETSGGHCISQWNNSPWSIENDHWFEAQSYRLAAGFTAWSIMAGRIPGC